ncbi:hypothetical protein D3093_26890 (plasmid) [Azospirillum argentinense]|uniref:Uncharacterized protein n=1 Tax=Azospirillum argentinense TaxID=2970906 RepID=A0A4D8PNW0_9PROT|nr:hypothetical protein [Azospirillum argentinense]QCN98914.1 hypothetical protein D3093_26890 [Azospirillum argentinense]
MADERYYDKLALLVKPETEYGVDAGPTAQANAILAQNVKIKPMAAEQIERKFYRNFWGARPKLRTGKHVTFDYEVEAAGSGTPGTAPAYAPILRMGALAQTIVVGLATIAAAATHGAGTTGRFSYAKTVKFGGQYKRTVTLTCTTPGASGVARFHVTAPATPVEAAYDVTNVAMTSGSPFNLPNGAQITPTVTTDFVAADTFTIVLTPERTLYTPVSGGVESCTTWCNIDGTLHVGLGCRAAVNLKVAKKGFPVWAVQSYGLFVPITAEDLPADCDYSAFQDPDETAPEAVKAFRLDGYEPTLSEVTFDLGTKVGLRAMANKQSIRTSGRDGSVSITIDEPPMDEKDFYALVDAGAPVPLWLRHGATAGNVIDVEARVQLQDLELADDENIKQLQLKGGLIPNLGGDEIAIAIQ